MTLGLAVVLLLASAAGIVLSAKYLRKSRAARLLCIVGCALIAVACAMYIVLTLLFIDAVSHQPPAGV